MFGSITIKRLLEPCQNVLLGQQYGKEISSLRTQLEVKSRQNEILQDKLSNLERNFQLGQESTVQSDINMARRRFLNGEKRSACV
jgi:hypothetical protein